MERGGGGSVPRGLGDDCRAACHNPHRAGKGQHVSRTLRIPELADLLLPGNLIRASNDAQRRQSNGGEGCDFGCGTLFKLAAVAPGSAALPWHETPLHRFGGAPYDGAQPYGPAVPATQPDGSLMLFGLALAGGHHNSNEGNGVIDELIP